ncbi:NF-kappa-B inhibitor-like protein [Wolffia australiana]
MGKSCGVAAEMNALCLRTGSSSLFLKRSSSFFKRSPLIDGSQRRRCLSVASLRSYLPRGYDVIEEDLMREFFVERLESGDLISKVSDLLWRKDSLNLQAEGENAAMEGLRSSAQSAQTEGVDDGDGFLKLAKAREWVLGDDDAPNNRKTIARDVKNDSDKRRKLNLLRYAALKKELTLLTIGLGAACSCYCLVTISPEAAISYVSGALLSCLYLQLLANHVDNLSKEEVPSIFLQKKSKKIGIRSEDLQSTFERTVRGCGIALSSPRLVFPAAIYGLWALSNQFFHDYFDFQLLFGMLGLFAYKAAALVQVYRDNKDLNLILPEDDI